MNRIIQELGSCRDDVSLDLLASWGTDLGLTLTSKQEVELDFTVELANQYSEFDFTVELADQYPEFDFTVELADQYPEFDFTVELAHLYPSPQRVKNTQRETRKIQHKSESEATVLNETSSYLYAKVDKEIRFTEWRKKLIRFSCVKHSLCKSKEEAYDLVSDFLGWVIKEDKLKDKTHKKVHFNWVQRTMFWQWLTRLRESQGQDAQHRHNNKYCRTQQEKKKKTEFHYPTTTAKVLNKRNSDGKITSSDMFFTQQKSFEEKIDNEEGWSLLYDEVDTLLDSEKDADKELWTSILSDFLNSRFEEVSKQKKLQDEAWANSYEISVKELRSIRRKVLKLLKKSPKILKIATTYFV